MYRQILIVGSNNDAKSHVIDELTEQNYSVGCSTTDVLFGIRETDPHIHDGCTYTFIDLTLGGKLSLFETDEGRHSDVCKNLNNYLKLGIHLVLFVTYNEALNPTVYDDFHFVVSTVSDKQIPMICVMLDCENERDIQRWTKKNHNFFVDEKMYFRTIFGINNKNQRSKSIHNIWKKIEEHSLTPSIPIDDHHASRNPEHCRASFETPSANRNAASVIKQKPPKTEGKLSLLLT